MYVCAAFRDDEDERKKLEKNVKRLFFCSFHLAFCCLIHEKLCIMNKVVYEGIMCLFSSFRATPSLTQRQQQMKFLLRHFSVDILISCECCLSAFSFAVYVI